MTQAIRIHANGGPEVMLWEDVPKPEPGPGEALVRIEGVTTCPQWDLHLRHNEPMFVGHKFHYPYTLGQPGHEATGSVEQVGDGVERLRVGDRVSVWRDAGHDVQGCYAQYAARPEGHLIKAPEGLPAAAVAPVELAMCVGASFLMLKEMNAVRSRRFGVMGLGPAGLVAVQMALAEGAREVVGFDLSAARRAKALEVGAASAHDPRELPADQFARRPNGTCLDCGIDCVGARASVQLLMDLTLDVVALFGVQREEYVFAPHHYGWLRLCGYRGHHIEAAQYAVSLIEAGKLDLAALVTHTLPLAKYAEGIDLLEKQEAIKVLFDPWA